MLTRGSLWLIRSVLLVSQKAALLKKHEFSNELGALRHNRRGVRLSLDCSLAQSQEL